MDLQVLGKNPRPGDPNKLEIDLPSELENYLDRIEDLRRQIKEIITGLPEEALNWRPIAAGDEEMTNSLAVLAAHSAGAEHFWIAEVIGRKPATRDREAEFMVHANDAEGLVQLLENTGVETRQVLTALPPMELDDDRLVRDRTVSVRWGILHVIDHTALHLGHMQLTYQLWQGGQATASPLWHERLPKRSDSGKP